MAYSVSALMTLNPAMKRTGFSYPTLLLCSLLALAATACGQRGPLYLPEPPETTEDAEKAEPDAEEIDETTPRT